MRSETLAIIQLFTMIFQLGTLICLFVVNRKHRKKMTDVEYYLSLSLYQCKEENCKHKFEIHDNQDLTKENCPKCGSKKFILIDESPNAKRFHK